MLDQSMYHKNITNLQTKIQDLETIGVAIPGTQELVLESLSHVENAPRVVVVSDTSTPQSVSVLAENDAVNVTAHDDYGALADPEAGVRNADMVILETSARLNQEILSKFGVAVGLSKPEMFIGVVQTGDESLDPEAYLAIANANQDDMNRVFAEKELHFTTLADLDNVLADQASTALYDKMTKTSVLLGRRISATIAHQETNLEMAESLLRSRRKYDFALKDMGIRLRAGETVSWEELFSTQMSNVFKRSTKEMFKTLGQHLKSYNGGVIYKKAVDHVRNGKKWNPRKKSDVEQLQRELQTLILIEAEQLRQNLIAQHQVDMQKGIVKSSKDTLKIIADDAFGKIEAELVVEIEELENLAGILEASIELDQLAMEIDAKKAVLSNLKRFGRIFMESLSGAILAVLVGMQVTPEPFSLVLWGIGGAAGKGIYAYTDLRDTERSNLQSIVETQIAGYLKDVEIAMRENLEDYVSSARDHVQISVEDISAWIASDLWEEMEMFDRLLSATTEELQSDVSEKENAISALNDLLADVQTLAEEAPAEEAPAEDTSEEVPAEEAPEAAASEEVPAEDTSEEVPVEAAPA